MMLLNEFRPNTVAGLGQWSYVVKVAGPHKLSCQSFMDAPSQLVITLAQNGSTLAVTPTTEPKQFTAFKQAYASCQPGDVLTITLTSASPLDLIPNNINSIMLISTE